MVYAPTSHTRIVYAVPAVAGLASVRQGSGGGVKGPWAMSSAEVP
jgi:hypothetical protein